MIKYPRTLHLPFSPGVASDDRIDWNYLSNMEGKRLIITEKMDGGNCSISNHGVFARSTQVETSHPSFSYVKQERARISYKLHTTYKDFILYGENLQATHSIPYKELPSFFLLFGILDPNLVWLSWSQMEEIAHDLELHMVPEVHRATDLKDTFLNALGNNIVKEGKEGIVIRNFDSFPNQEFQKNIWKWVRKDHVTTEKHWSRNWTENGLRK